MAVAVVGFYFYRKSLKSFKFELEVAGI